MNIIYVVILMNILLFFILLLLLAVFTYNIIANVSGKVKGNDIFVSVLIGRF